MNAYQEYLNLDEEKKIYYLSLIRTRKIKLEEIQNKTEQQTKILNSINEFLLQVGD